MDVSYQHANPRAGNESFLLRFESQEYHSQPACVLVDAGAGVAVDDLLTDDEYLTAAVLTHAHTDHYQSLAANLRDGASIYTSEATARLLETVLDEAKQYTNSANNTDADSDIETVLDALEPISDWTSVIEGLRIAPVPAGHTPGAAGFVFQFETDDQDHQQPRTILATGDWTTERAAGYPGFDTVLPVDVGAVFLTGATNDMYREALTESVRTICERALAGSPVLVSVSGLTGVQYAYLLGHLADHLERPLPVTVVGQAAKLYDDLGYEVPHVEAVATFDDPEELLASGRVTIAGPEVPTEGSSGRLFGAVRNDPSATLVQVTASDGTPVPSARCTTYNFAVVGHPTEETVDTLVEDLDPTQVIVTHQRGRAARRYRAKYNSFVWATDDDEQYTIFEDGEWVGPPWMTAEGREYVRRSNRSSFRMWLGDGYENDDSIPLPVCERITESAELEGRGATPATIDRLLSVADLFVVGEVAARSYFDGGTDETAGALARRDIEHAAVTCGGEGVLLIDGDAVIEIPAFETDVRDTTGAGDVFTAGLIHAWMLDGSPAVEAGRFAAAGAALNCTAEGARGRLPTKQDVHAFLEQR